ncbi:MAG: PilZ domain-containing protein [Nitrospira defluvii]|nr:PilZ domain-containing protein [Nitrospira defluvii]
MDQRQHPRFPVRFHSSFSSVNLVAGDGIVVDLSLRGCGILSSIDILPGTTLELRIYTPSSEGPLTVGQAVVRWCRSARVGLEFLSLQPGEWARLQEVVKELDRQPYQRTDEDGQGTDT